MSTQAKIALGTAAAGLLAATAVTVGRSKAGRTIARKAKDASRRLGEGVSRVGRTLRKGDTMASDMGRGKERGRGGRAGAADRGMRGTAMTSRGRSV